MSIRLDCGACEGTEHPGQALPAAQGAINAISQGLVDIRTQVFPLAEAAEAHRRAENGSVAGRILLAP